MALEPVDPPFNEDVVDERAEALEPPFGFDCPTAATNGGQRRYEDESSHEDRRSTTTLKCIVVYPLRVY
jgi:hypothetical protein